jgi:hypothetical protein
MMNEYSTSSPLFPLRLQGLSSFRVFLLDDYGGAYDDALAEQNAILHGVSRMPFYFDYYI